MWPVPAVCEVTQSLYAHLLKRIPEPPDAALRDGVKVELKRSDHV